MKTVGEVSELAGVSIRALHHYDELGLLAPSERTEAGYRLYSHDDLERLQEILVWRALGFPLARIKALLDEPGRHRLRSLREQRVLIDSQLDRLRAIARALDGALAAAENQTAQQEDKMFDGFDPAAYAQEAQERWGDTKQYAESMGRTRLYGEADWEAIRSEAGAIEAELSALMGAGQPADGADAMTAARRHREHISRWFYPCSPQMHAALGDMYVADPRLRAHYDDRSPGLAQYVRDAIIADSCGVQRS